MCARLPAKGSSLQMKVLGTSAASHKDIKKIPAAFRKRREKVTPLNSSATGAAFHNTADFRSFAEHGRHSEA